MKTISLTRTDGSKIEIDPSHPAYETMRNYIAKNMNTAFLAMGSLISIALGVVIALVGLQWGWIIFAIISLAPLAIKKVSPALTRTVFLIAGVACIYGWGLGFAAITIFVIPTLLGWEIRRRNSKNDLKGEAERIGAMLKE